MVIVAKTSEQWKTAERELDRKSGKGSYKPPNVVCTRTIELS